MSIQRAEELKQEWTDRQVVIRSGIPELRRFDGLVGHVRTVNMNGRLLIEFDTPADISWYDIDPHFVKIVESAPVQPSLEEPLEGTTRSPDSAPAAAKDATQANVSVAAVAAKPPAGESSTAATQTASDAVASFAASTTASSNPLDQIRAQAAADSEAPGTGERSATPTIFDQIRAQAAED